MFYNKPNWQYLFYFEALRFPGSSFFSDRIETSECTAINMSFGAIGSLVLHLYGLILMFDLEMSFDFS
jgi:hypothetical protein